MMRSSPGPLLTVRNLNVWLPEAHGGERHVIRHVSLELEPGRVVALVGESGSGKTLLGRSLIGLLPWTAQWRADELTLDGQALESASRAGWRDVRGRKIGLMFQEPMASFNPSMRIGLQIVEAMRLHSGLPPARIREAACRLLARVRVPDPEAALRRYPHEFSGGMRQRMMLASVMLPKPRLLIADEPTTALDTLVQKEVLDLMVELTREIGASVLFITHDLGLAAKYADDIAIMRHGEIVETGATSAVLARPKHDYVQRLLTSAAADVPTSARGLHDEPLVRLEDVRVAYRSRRSLFSRNAPHEAVRGVTLDLRAGETLAIVGESGSGKTTLGRALLGLVPLTSGRIVFRDIELRAGEREPARRIWARGQMIFQDPYSSLDPRMRALEAVTEGLSASTGEQPAQRREIAIQALRDVGLAGLEERYPHQLSGGQRQRLCIARVLALRPALIVADEPVAALDATIQRQVLDLLSELKRWRNFTCVFISHDLAAVQRIADRVAIMHRGELLECGPTAGIFSAPGHPYTRALLEARPLLYADGRGGFQLQRGRLATADAAHLRR